MLKRLINYSLIFILLFSLSTFIVNAQFKEGTCKNPSGGTFCGKKSLVSDCYCDGACITYNDCCSDYKEVCSTVPGGGGGGGSGKGAVSCTDSDEGVNYYAKGKLIGYEKNKVEFEDVCVEDGQVKTECKSSKCTVKEWVCAPTDTNPGGYTSYTYVCPSGCKKGACIKDASSKNALLLTDKSSYTIGEKISFKAKVTDSDGTPFTPEEGAEVSLNLISPDGKFGLGGILTYNSNSGYYERTESIDKGALVGNWEAYVTVSKGTVVLVTSKKIKFNIKAPLCQDSDDGKNYFVKGFMKSGTNDAGQWDSCLNANQLVEYYCENDVGAKEITSCSFGCNDGACILKNDCSGFNGPDSCLNESSCYWDQETNKCYTFDSTKQKCSDPDNGQNQYVQSHTFGFRTTYANDKDKRVRTGGLDGCVSGNQLIEHYCVDNYFIQTSYLNCPYSCKNGACVKNISLMTVILWTDKSTYAIGETIQFTAKVVENDGTPFTPEEGAVVNLNLISPNNAPALGGELKYNPNTGYYQAADLVNTNTLQGTWTAYVVVSIKGTSKVVATSEKIKFEIVEKAADYVKLHSLQIKDSSLEVTYSKNFPTCVHLVTENFGKTATLNFYCDVGDNLKVTQPLSSFFGIIAGQKLKLCHGNNYNICSDLVTVESSKCTDSDGGINYYVRGNTTGYEMSCVNYKTLSDHCGIEGPNLGKLYEYYCGQNNQIKECALNIQINEVVYTCPNGCKDGACIPKKQITKNDVIDYIEKDGIGAKITKEEAIKYVESNCYGSFPAATSTGDATGYVIAPIIIS